MSKKIGTQFFVEPFGEYTNGVIADYLNQSSLVNESSSVAGHTYRKKSINTFLIERDFALKLVESKKKDKALKFRVFYSRYGEHNVHMWKSGKIIYDEKKGKLKVVLGLDDKIKQGNKNMANVVEKMTKELTAYNIDWKTANLKNCLTDLDNISAVSKLLGRKAREVRKLLTPKPQKK